MSVTPTITQQIIDVGAAPNDGTGDPLRTAYEKVNNNFSNLFSTFVNSSIANTVGNTAGQIIFQYPANVFTQGQFTVTSAQANSVNSQTLQIDAQLNTSGNAVAFTASGTTFFGNVSVATYSMDVFGGNIRILANPLLSANVTHFVSSQVMFAGANVFSPS